MENKINRIKSMIEANAVRELVSVEYLQKVENDLGIIFPEEFKLFYSQVSNGLTTSPYRKLHSIETILNRIEQEKESSGMNLIQQKFTLENAYMWETPGEDEEAEDDDELYQLAYCGKIEIADMGCGETWHLIVNGNFYGTMWNCSEYGIAPCQPKLTFLDWVELWYLNKPIELDFSGSKWE